MTARDQLPRAMGASAFQSRPGRFARLDGQVTHEDGDAMNDRNRRWSNRGRGGGDAVYGLGLIGALVYYIQAADGFWSGVLGILKALVWPAFVIYDLLGFLAR
jgi:hypothetical protein